MTNQTSRTPQNRRSTPLAWSSRLELTSLDSDQLDRPRDAADFEPRRARSSKIEKEIIWAVVVLYAGIIACFAGLHLYGLALA